jgi:hypothetical protein
MPDQREARCPYCGGDVLIVRRRAWCGKPYDEGGCGAHWSGGRIVRELCGPCWENGWPRSIPSRPPIELPKEGA